MAAITNPPFASDRADVLAKAGVNGMRLVLAEVLSDGGAPFAGLDLLFWNTLQVAEIADAFNKANAAPVFRVRGGNRIVGGSARGQVHVAAVKTTPDPKRLRLTVEPIGDYSTYTLELMRSPLEIDPFFASLPFKFRPGCFGNDCTPAPVRSANVRGPAIDYLAKDYDSLRHTLMAAMAERVPGWASTSEADHDQVLIDLLAAAADELSDYQDRVANEAYLATARKRVSLTRHARLMDYHVHEGNQASTWLALELAEGAGRFTLGAEPLVVATAPDTTAPGTISFASREHRLPPADRVPLDARLNRLHLHTWRNAQPALLAGSTSADVIPIGGLADRAEAEALARQVVDGRWRQCLIAEQLNPRTGTPVGRDPRKRQRLQLRSGADAAQALFDPVVGTWLVRLNWRDEDALRFDYSFTALCGSGDAVTPVEDVSLFFGNLLAVHEGRPLTVHFHASDAVLPGDQGNELHRHYERGAWVLAPLPDGQPLAYLPPADGQAPNGEQAARSTLQLQVEAPAGPLEDWDEVESLVHSNDSTEQGDHFMVETDEQRMSVLRFGNGVNGRLLPAGSVVHARYQVGGGSAGNVGADRLTFLQPLGGALAGRVARAWNPFDVVDGRDPEPAEKIRRNAPESFRARQLRAVTLADYVRRAEEVPGVARAVARYAWTGSWRTVRITIDPVGFVAIGDAASDALWAELNPLVAAHLEAVRLIGEDLEIRPPRYVPLDIRVSVCARPEAWREDVRGVLEEEFSDGYTADGRSGFFHPDLWSFGQALHRSVIEGRLQAIPGIEHVLRIGMARFDQPTPGTPQPEVLEMGSDEVLLLANDPDQLQRGRIRFDVQGGRQ
jgi:hypothetical protein